MEKIGNILKEAREAKGLSIEDIHKMTKLLMPHLRAIENGDVDFFKDDLSYLSYYVRHYANAVGVDMSEFKNELDLLVVETTQNIEVDKIRKRLEINESIKGRCYTDNTTTKMKARKKRIDISFVTFIVASILLGALLIYVGIKYLPDWFNSDPVKPPTVIVPPEDENEPGDQDETPDEVEPEAPTFEVVFVAPNTLEVNGLTENDPIEIEIRFVSNATWIAASVNGSQVSEPASKTYVKDETIVLKESMVNNKEVMFHLGNMNGNEFYLNGERIEFEDAIQNSNGAVKIYFKFIEEGAVS